MPTGNLGQAEFKDPEDPDVCDTYLRNLSYFARQDVPMSCSRPVAPQLRDKIQPVKWTALAPEEHRDLFRALVARASGWERRAPTPEVEETTLRHAREAVSRGAYAFRMATVRARRSITLVQFGPDTSNPENPDLVWRCTPRRGGPSREAWTYLRTYVVSEDLRTLHGTLAALENGSSAEALRVIRGRPYAETVVPNGNVLLLEVHDAPAVMLRPVCRFLFKTLN